MGKAKSVRFLLEKGADKSIQDKTGRNAYEIAKFLNKQEIMELLETKLPKIISLKKLNDITIKFK